MSIQIKDAPAENHIGEVLFSGEEDE